MHRKESLYFYVDKSNLHACVHTMSSAQRVKKARLYRTVLGVSSGMRCGIMSFKIEERVPCRLSGYLSNSLPPTSEARSSSVLSLCQLQLATEGDLSPGPPAHEKSA